MTGKFNIEITEKAKERISKKNNVVSINVIEFTGCTGVYVGAEASMAKPFQPENYNLFNVDGIDVYVCKNAEVDPEGIKISVSDNWMFAQQGDSLDLSGINVDQSQIVY